MEGFAVFLLGVLVKVVKGSWLTTRPPLGGHHTPSQDEDQVCSGVWDPSKSQRFRDLKQQKGLWVGAG